jgi:hypothetical protein
MSFSNTTSLGEYSIAMDVSMARNILAGYELEMLHDIQTSSGMDGKKYRKLFLKHIEESIRAIMGSDYAAASKERKGFMLTAVLIALGSLLGFTGAKRVLVKNLGAQMATKMTETDPLAVAWRIIMTKFRTYVSDPLEKDKPLPSVKFCSSFAEFAMYGKLMVIAKTITFEEIAEIAFRKFIDWPEFITDQWFGNLQSSAALQTEHKNWEKYLWEKKITTTMNTSNTTFKKEFNETFYANTAKDNILLLTPQGGRLIPNDAAEGYTKAEVVGYILAMHKFFAPTSLEPSNTLSWTTPASASIIKTNTENMKIATFLTVNSLTMTDPEKLVLTRVETRINQNLAIEGGTEESKEAELPGGSRTTTRFGGLFGL